MTTVCFNTGVYPVVGDKSQLLGNLRDNCTANIHLDSYTYSLIVNGAWLRMAAFEATAYADSTTTLAESSG